jgi:hypothetical protein
VPFDVQESEFVRDYLGDRLREERQRLDLLDGRRSKPRCLSCGSEDCFALPKILDPPDSDDRPGDPVLTGIKHPNCGGYLMVSHPGIRLSIAFNHRAYDKEGILIRSKMMKNNSNWILTL